MHNDTPAISSVTVGRLDALVPALSLAAVALALVAPRMTPGLIVLLAAPVIALVGLSAGRLERLWPLPPIVVGLAALGLYLVVNALWAVDRPAALGKVALYALTVALVAQFAVSVSRLGPQTADRISHAVVVAVTAGAVYLAVEVLFDQPIRRLAGSLLPALRPPGKHSVIEGGWVSRIGLYTLNRNLALLNFVLWPALLLLRSRLDAGKARGLTALLLLVSAVAMFRSEHETSMLALLAGCAVFLAMSFAAPLTRRIVLAAWVAATLLIVPLAAWSHSAGLHQAQWLPGTARNRVVLWSVTAEKLRDAPILGIGVDSTKPLDEEAAPTAVRLEGQAYPLRTGRHAHNIFMQTWYELGAVGAVLLLAIGLLIQGALARLPSTVQPYAYASFVSACIIAAFSWGMWQPWFMAAFGIWACLLVLAVDAARRAASPR